jgi:hypothetical protein
MRYRTKAEQVTFIAFESGSGATPVELPVTREITPAGDIADSGAVETSCSQPIGRLVTA